MKSIFKFISSLILLTIILAGFLGYIGYLPQVAKILGTDRPRDLGIKVTEEIKKKALKKINVEQKKMVDSSDPSLSISYIGQHEVKEDFSGEELTAIANNSKWIYYPVANIQILISGNKMEITGLLKTERIIGYVIATGGSKYNIGNILLKIRLPKGTIPFYLAGTGSGKENKVLLKIEKLEIGRLSIPNNWVKDNIKYIEIFAEERIKFVRGLEIKSATLENDQFKFSGKLPDLEGTINQ